MLADIAYQYMIDNNIDEFGTDNLNMFHEIYDLYKQSKTYKPLKNEHPLNKLRAVRNAIRKDKRFISQGWFGSCWGRITLYKVNRKEN